MLGWSKHKIGLLLFLLMGLAAPSVAQVDGIPDIEGPLQLFLLRQQVAGQLVGAHLSHRPVSAYDARKYLLSMKGLTGVDEHLRLQYLGIAPFPGAKTINRLWSALYKNGQDFYSTGGFDDDDVQSTVESSDQQPSSEKIDEGAPIPNTSEYPWGDAYTFPDSSFFGAGGSFAVQDSTSPESPFKVASSMLNSLNTSAFTQPYHSFNASGFPNQKSWAVQVNPIFYMSSGKATFSSDPKDRKSADVWRNTRGIRLSGHVGTHIYFEGQLTENQEMVVDPSIENRTSPGRPFTIPGKDGAYDWMDTRAVVGFQWTHFDIRIGRDKNLWGYGSRSVMLSNAAAAFDQVQLRTTLGPFQFTNIFAAPLNYEIPPGDQLRLRKYQASHRLAIKIGKRAEISIFETVMFGTDSLQTRSRFDLAYINPIIFLSVAERDRGCPDNYMVGLSGSIRPDNTILLYGEFLLDNFKSDNKGKGWWANKWAWQVGAYLAKLPVRRADLRIEMARMRPFLYSHSNTTNSFTHLGDPLGHLSGPNARNILVESTWLLSRRINLRIAADLTWQGRNTATENLGSDPNLSYDTRARDFGNDFLQGNLVRTQAINGLLSFELLPNAFLDASVWYVTIAQDLVPEESYVLPMFAFRWNTAAPRSLPR
jgi:hypothetical protein